MELKTSEHAVFLPSPTHNGHDERTVLDVDQETQVRTPDSVSFVGHRASDGRLPESPVLRQSVAMSFAKRSFDITLSLALGAILLLPLLVVALAVKITSKGPVLHWSDRVGLNKAMFKMPKFRSMYVGAPQLPKDQMVKPESWVTPLGRFLRVTSLDETPQLWSILVGDMSFVGPRPALFNYFDIISLRSQLGVHQLKPGLTGWAQVNGRDTLSVPATIAYDAEYLDRISLVFDMRIMAMTVWTVLRRDNIAH